MAARPASPPTPVVSIDPAWAGSDVQEPGVLTYDWTKNGGQVTSFFEKNYVHIARSEQEEQ